MSNELSSFVIGTCFFMLGHIFYIIAFRIGDNVKIMDNINKLIRYGIYLVIIGATIGNIILFWDKFPVRMIYVAYTIVLGV